MHGIDYVYEDRYGVGNYRPDFHIPGTDVWIEYWGVNAEGRVPPWFEGHGGLDPSVSYRESMEWKRDLHRRRGTDLIELYSWQKRDGTLDRELGRQLRKRGIRGSPRRAAGNRLRRAFGLRGRPYRDGTDSTEGRRTGHTMRTTRI